MDEYTDEAQAIVAAAQNIKTAIAQHGFGTATTMVILGELLKMTQVTGDFMDLPSDQRDEFFAALWDESIGTEPNALVKKVGLFQGEVLSRCPTPSRAALWPTSTAPCRRLLSQRPTDDYLGGSFGGRLSGIIFRSQAVKINGHVMRMIEDESHVK